MDADVRFGLKKRRVSYRRKSGYAEREERVQTCSIDFDVVFLLGEVAVNVGWMAMMG